MIQWNTKSHKEWREKLKEKDRRESEILVKIVTQAKIVLIIEKLQDFSQQREMKTINPGFFNMERKQITRHKKQIKR